MAKKSAAPDSDRILQLDPTTITAVDNIRFKKLDAARVNSLVASILAVGEVQTPLEVEMIDGQPHLVTGFYRLAAALKINQEKGGDITVPVRVIQVASKVARMKRQLTENLERKDMSLIDIATAITKLEGEGVSEVEIRALFKRPGKKGAEAASPAWLRIVKSMLTLDAAIQSKIHEGKIGYSAAYELAKLPAEKQAAVLARAEAAVASELETEEADNDKFEKAEEKRVKAEQKAQALEDQIAKAQTAVVEAKAAADAAHKLYGEKRDLRTAVQKEDYDPGDKDSAKKHKEALAAAEKDEAGAKSEHIRASGVLAKLFAKKPAAAREVEVATKKATVAKKVVESNEKKKTVSDTAVKKAAKAEGVDDGNHVVLKFPDVKQGLAELTAAAVKAKYPRVAKIGAALKLFMDGVSAPKVLIEELAVITGELKAAPKK